MRIQKLRLTRKIIRQRIAEMERLGLIKHPKKHALPR